ncbi:hypothetical protein CONLIGDRAFT_496838 [Coniochaeta ligniaria NRRL 30616]|uniref:MARVEL domain-containing protein n=1 Tax=Coniochaeta ligniaria NRRL 30616 TaxID=1408157 RepID=A0A1J7IHA5_9PEZI|nr:hypothetical protein CONLIGDRAFT_496838 [Coniochaeta ligniaria NRRL 30616]
MSDNLSERAPLLGSRRDAAAEWETGGVPAVLLQRSFVLATMASLIAGTFTVVFLIASMIIVSYRPRDYYPPYELNYYFASTAGWSIIAIIHSAFTLIRIRAGDTPPRGLAGILVDVVAGLYFLFQSLHGMQNFLQRDNFGCHVPWRSDPRRPADPDCDVWRARAEPVFWCYLVFLFIFGLAHAVLLFLRASLWKRTDKELLVRLVGQDNNQARASAEGGP